MATPSASSLEEPGLIAKPYDYAWVRSKNPSAFSENVKAPLGGSTTSIVGQNSTQMFQFLIQRDVQNLYRSIITGTYVLLGNTAGLAMAVANRPWIDSILLTNSSGANIVNLTYAQQYLQVCRLRQTTWDSWINNQLSDHGNPSRVQKNSSQALICVPTSIPYTTSSASPSMVPVPACQLDIDYYAPLMVRTVPTATTITTNFSWQLGDLFPDTFFGLDCSLRFPEDLTLTVNLAAEQNFSWWMNTQADLTLGAVIPTGGAGTLTNFRLRLQVETNVERRAEVIRMCKTGFAIPIPYTLPYRYAIPISAGNISQDIPFGSGQGSELRKIVVTLWDQTPTIYSSCNCSNIDGQTGVGTTYYGKVASYQTKVGSTLLQVAPLNCTPILGGSTEIYGDWEWNRKLGGDSPLFQSRLTYQQYWHHCDDFQGMKPTGDEYSIQKSMVLGGIPLSGISGSEQVVYNFTATLPAVTSPMALIAFATFTKTLQWTDSLLLLL